MAGLLFGFPDSKGTSAYLRKGGINKFSITASRLPFNTN
jgi:hypothetical protein